MGAHRIYAIPPKAAVRPHARAERLVMGQGYIDPDYVDVAERIRLFYGMFPDGRIVSAEHGYYTEGDKTFVWCVAKVYANATDVNPRGVGRAWEPIPGPTPFTKDSELMNAETAAWGRAIVAAGIPSKKIASADEVQARTGGNAAPPAPAATAADDKRTDAQNRRLHALIRKLDAEQTTTTPHENWKAYCSWWIIERYGKHSSTELTKAEAHELIDHLEALAVPFG